MLFRSNANIVTVGTITSGTWQGTTIAAAYIGNHSTDKLTSGTLPVARGGTGQTSVANIQAGKDGDGNTISSTYLKRSAGTGSTLTGNLYMNRGGVSFNAIRFGTTAATGTDYTTVAQNDWGILYCDYPVKKNADSTYTSGRFYFRQYSPTSAGARTSYYDQYRLPTTTVGKTANNTYDILTTRSAVTVAQGGTGATTAAGALKNLGVLSKTVTGTPSTAGNLSLGLSSSTYYVLAVHAASTNSGGTFVPLPYTTSDTWYVHCIHSSSSYSIEPDKIVLDVLYVKLDTL